MEGAFGGYIGLTEIIIPNSVETIGKLAFEACSGLKTLTIPTSVTEIKNYAFSNCEIRSRIADFDNVKFGEYVFKIVPRNTCKLKVPVGSKTEYKVTHIWKEFLNVEEEPSLSVLEVTKTIKTFKLNQNYPNPFNSETTISYELPPSGEVLIEVYNSFGQKIVALLNEKNRRLPQSNFEGINLQSGIYIYKISYNNKMLTKK